MEISPRGGKKTLFNSMKTAGVAWAEFSVRLREAIRATGVV